MNAKEFARKAIKNGYTSNMCEGWDWIRENLHELDFIFQLEDYKKQDGMKYLCMPFLLKDNTFSEIEENALGTAWYLNNTREHEKQKQERENNLLSKGYRIIDYEMVQEAVNRESKIITVMEGENFFGGRIEKETLLKPLITHDKMAFLMPPRCRTKGYCINGRNWYGKIVK